MAVDTDMVEMEVSLFHAMRGHKPVGVNRHFQMLLIHDKLNSSFNRNITAKQIWNHLMTMYDLQALNESEILPFPNRETDFMLPEQEYSGLIHKEFPRIASSAGSSKTTQEDNKPDNKPDKSLPAKLTKNEKLEVTKVENKHTSGVLHANTPESSPKRKRTRQTQSTHASPATPEVPAKRRR